MQGTKSIRFKIVSISIITLLLALTLLAVISYYQSRQELENYMEGTISTLASSIAGEISLWLESCTVEIKTSALALAGMETKEEQLAFMSEVIAHSNIYETMFLADADGDYFITEGDDGNVADRAYFIEVMTGKTVVADPVVSRATGRNVIVVAAPIMEEGQPAGLVGLTVSLEDLADSIVTRQVGETGYPYIVQSDGLVIAHPDHELAMTLNTIADEELDPNLREAMSEATAGNSGISRYIFDEIDKYVSYAPVPAPAPGWAIAITVPVSELHAQLSSLPITFIFLTAGIALVAALLSNVLLTRLVTKPLDQMRRMIGGAAEGDMTLRGEKITDDEIGHLTTDFNSFMDRVHILIKSVHDNADNFRSSMEDMLSVVDVMTKNSDALNSKTNAVNQAVQEITGSIGQTAGASSDASESISVIAAAVEEMHSTIQHQAASTEEISSSLEHVSLGVNQVATNVDEVSSSAQEMSGAVNNVATAVKEINISLNEVSLSCERSTRITDDAETKALETKEIIENLNQSSTQIGKIIDVINDIADQTNMLALNAAIEAAGAGEAGRGFAVVANEVKELARQTAEATEEISRQIETMQTNMQQAVVAVETINGVIEESNSITGTIASAVAEQSAATGEISSSIVQAAERVSIITQNIADVASSIKEAAENVAEVSSGVHEIAHSTNELADGTNEVAESAANASAKVGRVAEEAEGIAGRADEIAVSIEDISKLSTEDIKIVTETGKSAQKIDKLFNALEEMCKQFKV